MCEDALRRALVGKIVYNIGRPCQEDATSGSGSDSALRYIFSFGFVAGVGAFISAHNVQYSVLDIVGIVRSQGV